MIVNRSRLQFVVYLVDGFAQLGQAGEQALKQVKPQHVGAVALGHRGILMRFQEQAVGTGSNGGTCHR